MKVNWEEFRNLLLIVVITILVSQFLTCGGEVIIEETANSHEYKMRELEVISGCPSYKTENP